LLPSVLFDGAEASKLHSPITFKPSDPTPLKARLSEGEVSEEIGGNMRPLMPLEWSPAFFKDGQLDDLSEA